MKGDCRPNQVRPPLLKALLILVLVVTSGIVSVQHCRLVTAQQLDAPLIWTTLSPITTPRNSPATVIASDYTYVIGSNTDETPTHTVEYAAIVPNAVAPAQPCQPVEEVDFDWSPPHPSVSDTITLSSRILAHSDWFTTAVGNGEMVYRINSLALDAADLPHISYYSYQDPSPILAYARYDGLTWYTDTVDTSGDFNSLALDSNNLPHISYYDDFNYALKYAWFDGTSWYSTTVDSGPNQYFAAYTSLALDAANHPHISYLTNVGSGELRYAHYDGTSWGIQIVDTDLGADTLQKSYTSLALDAAGYPHISYYETIDGHLKYAWYDGASWHPEIVDDTYYVGKYASLGLDAAGQPHISYYDAYYGGLRYAFHDGSTWHIEVIDDSSYFAGTHTSLDLDSAGRPHIIYFNGDTGMLHYAWNSGTAWVTQTVVQGLYNPYPSMALDTADQPRISYAAESWPCELHYAWQETVPPTPPVSYTWDLGDGTWATGISATHSYTQPGTYTVVLTASNCGGSAVVTKEIRVTERGYRIYLPIVLKNHSTGVESNPTRGAQ